MYILYQCDPCILNYDCCSYWFLWSFLLFGLILGCAIVFDTHMRLYIHFTVEGGCVASPDTLALEEEEEGKAVADLVLFL